GAVLPQLVDAAEGGDDGLPRSAVDAVVLDDLEILGPARKFAAKEHEGACVSTTTFIAPLRCILQAINLSLVALQLCQNSATPPENQRVAGRNSPFTVEDGSHAGPCLDSLPNTRSSRTGSRHFQFVFGWL